MRIGLLSDVHANHAALQAALRWLEDQGAERLLVAGDLVGYGPQPNECVEQLAAAGAECVAGNHDLFVLDRLPPTRFPPLARRSADLTRSLISADVRAFLEALPVRLHMDHILMTHGSLDSPEEYVVDERRAGELLRRMPKEAPGCDTLVLGHTHRQWCVVADHGALRPRGRRVSLPGTARLLNPGSVGQSRQRERRPRARFALYDSSALGVEFIRLDYDVDSSRRALQQLGLPDRCLHAPPRVRGRIRGVARRILGPVRGTRAGRV
jgi:predicted phosphodiesterase